MKRHLLIAAMVFTALAGCSSSDTESPGSSGSSGTSGSSGSSGTSGSPDTSSGGESSSGGQTAGPQAPKLEELMKMSGALHVMWTNPDEGCDAIEGERKATMAGGMVHEEYKVVFTEPGEADNKHDMGATEDMDYTYRLRCKKGDKYSAYSNELTKNPMK